jgi:NTP pyrophosphatase (non-canonical NTP hydrolase)
MKDLEEVRQSVTKFSQERDWGQFHSPKNLSMALSIEVAELMEHFQWLTQAQSRDLDTDTLLEVSKELADVQVYLVLLADMLNIDLLEAVQKKMQENADKYPADKVRGSAKKYSQY